MNRYLVLKTQWATSDTCIISDLQLTMCSCAQQVVNLGYVPPTVSTSD